MQCKPKLSWYDNQCLHTTLCFVLYFTRFTAFHSIRSIHLRQQGACIKSNKRPSTGENLTVLMEGKTHEHRWRQEVGPESKHKSYASQVKQDDKNCSQPSCVRLNMSTDAYILLCQGWKTNGRGFFLPIRRLSMTSCPAALSLLYRQ